MIPQITLVVPGRWHAFDLARELQELGALHRIVTTYPRFRTRRWAIPDAKVVTLPLALLLTKLAWKLGGERLAMRLNFRINDQFARKAGRQLGRPDLVHAWSGSAEPSLLAARARGIPTCLERSSSHMLEQCRILREEHAAVGVPWNETPRATVERELREYELTGRVFVPSRFVERSFLARGFPAERLFRNGFGVDLSRFTPGSKTDRVFRVIYAGSLSVRKGIHHLVRAFKEADIPRSELLLVGGTMSETERLIGSADPRIRLTGQVAQAELPAVYHSGSVFAMASIEEGQALVQAQALACGLPLICTTNTGGEDFLNTSGAPAAQGDSVVEYPAGFIVPVGDASAMACALGKLASSPVKLEDKRLAAVDFARRDLSWRRYAAANLAEYAALVMSSESQS